MKQKPLKIALWGLLSLLALVVIAFVVVTGRIDGIAQGIIDRGATDAFGLKSGTDSVRVSIFTGGVGVRGFRVANVDGFEEKHFLDLGALDVSVELGTLFEETLVVPSIQLSDLDLYIEQKGLKSNASVLLENIRKRSGGKAAEPAGGETPTKKLRVSELRLRNITAHVRLLPLGGNISTVKVKLPSLVLKDVTPENAQEIAVDELLRQVFPAILAAVLEQGRDVLPTDLIDGLGKELGKTVAELGGEAQRHLKDAAGGMADGILKDLPDVLGKEVEKGVEGIGEKIGGLLGGEKKEDEPK